MKTRENTSTTSLTDNDCNEVNDVKIMTLYKLVYHEKKSIKQASHYLKIKYNTAKRIIKKLRKNQISVDQSKLDVVKEKDYGSEKLVIKRLLGEISYLTNTLKGLNDDIHMNKNIIAVLCQLMKQRCM
jgi:hypothetical protein